MKFPLRTSYFPSWGLQDTVEKWSESNLPSSFLFSLSLFLFTRKTAVKNFIHIYWASLVCWLLWNTRTWKIQWPGPGQKLIIAFWENETHDQLLPGDREGSTEIIPLGSAVVVHGREEEVWTVGKCSRKKVNQNVDLQQSLWLEWIWGKGVS